MSVKVAGNLDALRVAVEEHCLAGDDCILVVKVGTDERPADSKDLDDVEQAVKKIVETCTRPVQVLVCHHACEFHALNLGDCMKPQWYQVWPPTVEEKRQTPYTQDNLKSQADKNRESWQSSKEYEDDTKYYELEAKYNKLVEAARRVIRTHICDVNDDFHEAMADLVDCL